MAIFGCFKMGCSDFHVCVLRSRSRTGCGHSVARKFCEYIRLHSQDVSSGLVQGHLVVPSDKLFKFAISHVYIIHKDCVIHIYGPVPRPPAPPMVSPLQARLRPVPPFHRGERGTSLTYFIHTLYTIHNLYTPYILYIHSNTPTTGGRENLSFSTLTIGGMKYKFG